jgi:hypothetical protein
LDIDVQDTVPPKITGVSGLPASGGTIGLVTNPITVSFSEDMQSTGANAATTWEMRSAGIDNAFDTGDDVVYTLSRSVSSRSVDLRVTDGPLQPGQYRFTALATGLLDRFGNLLDGNSDTTGGDNFTRLFSVVIPAGTVLENRSNDSIPAATPLPMTEDPVGSGFFTSSIAIGALDPGGEVDYWSFPAQAGDKLIIDYERTSGNFGPRFIVFNAAGQALVDNASWGRGFGSPSKVTNSVFTIPSNGTYYVWTRVTSFASILDEAFN